MLDDVRPGFVDLTAEQREELAAGWWADARDASRSARAYSQLGRQLEGVSAPAALVRAAAGAHREELGRAKAYRELAASYGPEVEVQPSPAPNPLTAPSKAPRPAQERRRSTVPVRILFDGCVGEPLRASLAQTAAEGCADAAARSVLRRAVIQSSRHAGLCWRAMRWLISDDRQLVPRHALARAVARLLAQLRPHPVGVNPTSPSWAAAHGRLSPERQRAVAASCLHDVVAPCFQALLANSVGKPQHADERSADPTRPHHGPQAP